MTVGVFVGVCVGVGDFVGVGVFDVAGAAETSQALAGVQTGPDGVPAPPATDPWAARRVLTAITAATRG